MLPEPNVRPQKPFESNFGRFKGETESNLQFNAKNQQRHYMEALKERTQFKEYQKK